MLTGGPLSSAAERMGCAGIAEGHTLFVATSKPQVQAKRIVDHFGLGEFFETVYGCELDGTRSRKPELLAYAIAQNPGAIPRTMVGDRKHDLIGAVANGIRPIGVSYGYGSIEELTAAGAIKIVGTPSALPEVLSERAGSRTT